MNDLKARIEELAISNLEKAELFVVDTQVSGNPGGTRKITIWLDGDNGVSVEDCAKLSRKLGEIIETENLIDSAYLLEVSSPGVDQPLKSIRQYRKNIGRKLSVMTIENEVKKGKLTDVKDSGIVLEEEVKEKSAGKGKKLNSVSVEIPFDQIKKSNVLIAFN